MILDDLPTRTLNRPVCRIVSSHNPKDEGLALAIIAIAQGDKCEWTHDEALELIASLTANQEPLGAWIENHQEAK